MGYRVHIASFNDHLTRDGGVEVREMIEDIWDEADEITVDFGNKRVASISFMDEAFGKLAFKYGREELVDKLRPIRIQSFDRMLLNEMVLLRLKQRSEMAHRPARRVVRVRVRKARKNKKRVLKKK